MSSDARAESPGGSQKTLELFAAFVDDFGARADEAADAAFEELCGEHPDLAAELRDHRANWKRIAAALPRMAETTSFSRKLKERYGAEVDPGISLDAPVKGPADSSSFEKFFRQLRERGSPGTRYVVHDLLGKGGMGVVYSVWDEDLRRHLAMKVIRRKGELEIELPRVGKTPTPKGGVKDAAPAPLPIDPLSLGRFLEEAQVTGQLNHPGIVPVHEIGLDADGRVYFTMRQVKGATFSQVIEWVEKGGGPDAARVGESPWTETRALSVLVAACDALAYAHDKGVVHRDLKPANVMVGRFGEVYVMDWGLARVLGRKDRHDVRPRPIAESTPLATDRRDAASSRDDSPIITMDGAVVGTPAYMPPEQAFGKTEQIDRRSDVYSVGAMLYHLLTRRAPYAEPGARVSQHTVLALVQTGPPKPIHALRSDVPVELAAICEKAMARERERRYPDTQLLAADLRAYLEHRVVKAYETGAVAELKKWVERNKALAASLAAVVLLVIGATSLNAWQSRRHGDAMSKKNVELTAATTLAQANATAATEQATRADVARKEAEDRLAEVTRLSDIKRVRDLEARASKLWPAWPELVPAMQMWLADAREVVSRLPTHEQSLAKLREQALRPDAETQIRWWHDQLEELVAAIHALDGPLVEPPDTLAAWKPAATEEAPPAAFVSASATLRAMKCRIDHAAWVEEVSLDDEVDPWREAIDRIAQNPKYDGLKVTDQLGLVPLGPDPDSKLEEFWHVESGARPRRDAKSGHVMMEVAAGLVLVLIPGGIFTMGSRLSDPDHPLGAPDVDPRRQPAQQPAHDVTLSPFFLSKFEMTQAQWLRTAGSNPSFFTDRGAGSAYPLTSPVETVPWTDASKLSGRIGLKLPTEAQWEYATRAGTTSTWWIGYDVAALGRGRAGNLFDQTARKAGYAGDAESWDDGFRDVAPVGSFAANGFGLHDVIGNVGEWCEDELVDYGLAPPRAGDGLRALAVQSGPRFRVIRGGSWGVEAAFACSAYRYRADPSERDRNLGLRPARVVTE